MRTPANGLLTRSPPRRPPPPSHRLALGLGHRFPRVELLAALRDLVRRELGEVEVVLLPALRGPALRRVHGGAGSGGALEQPERQLERVPLRRRVERPA